MLANETPKCVIKSDTRQLRNPTAPDVRPFLVRKEFGDLGIEGVREHPREKSR